MDRMHTNTVHRRYTQTEADGGCEALDLVWVAGVNFTWDKTLAGYSLHK